ncbi:hypothetical protein EIP91_008590 [Steccherinum ochraceum]|uniref:Alcohol dehydrogenase-like C-terminal domain-containing protein n=1 Tax=Steccherinum ochraceum TaxID=92696 RepID=A0A4R0RAT4_9APHY|nr:hypothetical protein EIP91_008590 [Steccherinum ochraceum]
MPSVTNGRLIYVAQPSGFQEPGVHTLYVEEQIDLDNVPLHGGVLIKTLVLSSDPYLRVRMRDPSIPSLFPAFHIGLPYVILLDRRTESDDTMEQPGDYVYSYLTFENYSVYPGPEDLQHVLKFIRKLDKHPDLPFSIYVGALGMPGETAYAGWNAYAAEKAKTSKTLFVSSAAGAVGMFLIEYVKCTAPHLKIIACAGYPEKVQMLKEAGVDVAFNYKTEDTAKVLAEHGPIDICWDHVSGPILDAALANMEYFGIIVRVGTSSSYNTAKSSVQNMGLVVDKSLSMFGLIVGFGEVMKKAAETHIEDATKLILAAKIKSRETRYRGLQEAGRALADIHRGLCTGKPVIIVAEE